MPMFQDAFDTIGLIKDLHPRNPQLEEKSGDDNAPSGYGDLTNEELKRLRLSPQEIEKTKNEWIKQYGHEYGIRTFDNYLKELKKTARAYFNDGNDSAGYGDLTNEELKRIRVSPQEIEKTKNEWIKEYGQEDGTNAFNSYLKELKNTARNFSNADKGIKEEVIPNVEEKKPAAGNARSFANPENAAASSLQLSPTSSTVSTPPQATTQGGLPKKRGGLNKFIEEVNASAKKAKIAAEDIGVPKGKKRELIVDAGDQYDPETGKLISPEKINLLVAQETARRLANKPYEANPYNRSAGMNELEKGGYRVLNDLVQEGLNPSSSSKFRAKEGIGHMALDRFADQDSRYNRTMTLKDRLISDIRANAQARLQDSFHDMGMKLSSQKIGRSGIDDLLKVRMTENMNKQLNELDSKMAYDMMAQQNQLAGQETEFAMRQDEADHKKALDQYRLNKIEEEARKEEQRKNALNAVSQGTALRQSDQEDLNRKAQEYDRKTKHNETQVDSYIRRVNEARIGTPAQILPEKIQSFAPTHMRGVQPGEPSRMPLAGGAPILTQIEPDTTLKDAASVGLAGAGLILKNKEIDKLGKMST